MQLVPLSQLRSIVRVARGTPKPEPAAHLAIRERALYRLPNYLRICFTRVTSPRRRRHRHFSRPRDRTSNRFRHRHVGPRKGKGPAKFSQHPPGRGGGQAKFRMQGHRFPRPAWRPHRSFRVASSHEAHVYVLWFLDNEPSSPPTALHPGLSGQPRSVRPGPHCKQTLHRQRYHSLTGQEGAQLHMAG